MSLRDYHRKRQFDQTPEPKGAVKQASAATSAHRLAFVVQEHHATALHYDFRLEMDGVLRSWAVPKGPSLDPHEHHLAIQTEDHPYEYRRFEGVIPEGQYGAGNVIIWDEGWYEPKIIKPGHITVILHGKKLKGEFALIKMPHAKEDNAWLLIKKGDEYASDADITRQDQSVETGRRVDDLGGKLPDLSKLPKIAKPWPVKPMLCTLVDEPFSRDGWLFEIKWDGYRAIGTKHRDKVELYSRNGLDFAAKYPPVFEALHSFKHDVIVDGEVVVVDEHGASHFEWLQHWHDDPHGSLRYYLFDLLWLDGHDLRSLPLTQRKAMLRTILPKSAVLQYSDHIETDGDKLFAQMQSRGLEGMVAKRADAPYREGDRGQDWLKVKTGYQQEFVIGGYTEPRGTRQYLGSLLIGYYDHGQLVYAGHSGGGIADDDRKALLTQLHKLERPTSPFAPPEPKPNAPVHWVEPKLVCEMAFTEWTSDGSLRHPRYLGLRPDKAATEVHREQPKHTRTTSVAQDAPKTSHNSSGLPFEKTHEDKVFFPKAGITKGDLFAYYESVADFILPYLQDRPLSLNRQPGGITDHGFYQKNNPHLPDWAPSADIFSESTNETLHWLVGRDLPTLLYMVQLGCIEINPWTARVGHLDRPDWLVIDLDPEGVTFEDVITVARTTHAVLGDWHIPSYPKTSGKSGLHVFIPLGAKYTHDQSRDLAHLIVIEVNKREPKLTSIERNPDKRPHKIYLDWLQNREGQTLAAPYSVRPTPTATVSMPLHWDEVKPGLSPTDFDIKNALARLHRTGDLMAPVLGPGIDLAAILARLTPPA